MDVFTNLMTGFGAAGTWANIGFALIGCVLGTLIGGMVIAMYLPIFKMGQAV